jgi:hypothetical protein
MPGADDGRFLIWSEDNRIKFNANFGDGPAIVTEGYAGWQVVSRPKDVGITTWQGRWTTCRSGEAATLTIRAWLARTR